MNSTDQFNRMQERHDHAEPREPVAMEPTFFDIEEAFDQLAQDTATQMNFLDEAAPDTTTVFQLYAKHGLPRFDQSPQDDALVEAYTGTLNAFLGAYRRWLEANGLLRTVAIRVMAERVETAKQDAAEAAAEARDAHLNGGW